MWLTGAGAWRSNVAAKQNSGRRMTPSGSSRPALDQEAKNERRGEPIARQCFLSSAPPALRFSRRHPCPHPVTP